MELAGTTRCGTVSFRLLSDRLVATSTIYIILCNFDSMISYIFNFSLKTVIIRLTKVILVLH